MTLVDVIVVGAGGIGSAAAFHLASRGARVVVIDRFPVPHAHGSSHGQTRLIRLAYFEHPDYVPLLRRAYGLWRELEALSGRTLLVESGLLMAGPPEGEVLRGVGLSARTHGLAIDRMSSAEATRRFPAFALPEHWEAVFESCGGYLFVEACVEAHLDAARRAGARVETGAEVRDWRADGQGVVVDTDRGSFSAGRLVLAPGAWAHGLLRLPATPLTVLRKSLFWYRPRAEVATRFERGSLPCFAFDSPDGFFYGFPQLDPRGVKVAEHSGGRGVDEPLAVDRGLDADERSRIERAAATHLPALGRDLADHAVCLYTMSSDGHFLVGPHPHHDAVTIAAGFSGHGFKFAGVIGEVLADLALDGRTRHPVGFLGVR